MRPGDLFLRGFVAFCGGIIGASVAPVLVVLALMATAFVRGNPEIGMLVGLYGLLSIPVGLVLGVIVAWVVSGWRPNGRDPSPDRGDFSPESDR